MNGSGQLGAGDYEERPSPVQAGTATTWSSLATGGFHACGIRDDGTLWCWGANYHAGER